MIRSRVHTIGPCIDTIGSRPVIRRSRFAGVLFFALSKHVAHMHGLWHLCVIGGSVCHYVAVYRYVAF